MVPAFNFSGWGGQAGRARTCGGRGPAATVRDVRAALQRTYGRLSGVRRMTMGQSERWSEQHQTAAEAAAAGDPTAREALGQSGGSDRPRLLVLCCGAGGAAVGYHRAGFYVVGVDKPATAELSVRVLRSGRAQHSRVLDRGRSASGDSRLSHIGGLRCIHASPPCQGYANVTQWRGSQSDHERLIEPVRDLLRRTGLPYIIENVRTKALRPCVVLCGSMFGLPIRRHRGFETSWNESPMVLACHHRSTDLARLPLGERAYADAMGCNWMTVREAREAIPPAYAEHVGLFLRAELFLKTRAA